MMDIHPTTAKTPPPGLRHFLEVDDLTVDELNAVLTASQRPDLEWVLDNNSVTLLFEKPSARTRTSMELAVTQLGGHPVTLRNEEVGIDTRETAEDLARLFSGYSAAIGARVFAHDKAERLAQASAVPVINLLSDRSHPIQALADLLTIQQEFGTFDDVVVAYVGDANNVTRSLGIACLMLGIEFRVSSPVGYELAQDDFAALAAHGFDQNHVYSVPEVAVHNADVVYTDAWYSMGQEDEQEQRAATFADWQINETLLTGVSDRAIFLHCLPAHRGQEVTNEVLDGPRSRIWRQANNRMHTARGLLYWLLSQGGGQ